jgi:hypothetical protein
MPREGAVTLSDLIAPTLTLDCKPCGRKGVYSVARLQVKHGDARLTDLRTFLTANCPNRAKRSIHAQCAAKYDPSPVRSGRRRREVAYDRTLVTVRNVSALIVKQLKQPS